MATTATNLNIPDFGIGVPGRHAVWAVSSADGGMSISSSTLADTRNDSSNFTFTLTGNTTPSNPAAIVPTGLVANAYALSGNTSQVTLGWLTSQFATSYHVKRAAISGGPYTTVATTTASGYVDAGLTSGAAYYYVVSALNGSGVESANSLEVTPTPSTAMTFTTGTFNDNSVLSLMGATSKEVYGVGLGSNTSSHTTANGYAFVGFPSTAATSDITVSGNSNAYAGFLSTATSGDANFNPVLNSSALGNTGQSYSLTLNGLTVGKTYNALFLVMDARSGVGSREFSIGSGSVQSATQPFAFEAVTPNYIGSYALCNFTATATTQAFSIGIGYDAENYSQLNAVLLGTAGTAAVAPSSPTGVTATAGIQQVTLNWTAASGATSYNVKRAMISGGTYTTIASPTSNSYLDIGVTAGTPYYYVISAVKGGGESPNSSEVSATPLQSGYLAYLAQFNLSDTSPTADPDHIGVSNLLLYAFNLTPTGSAVTSLPTGSVQNGYLTISYVERIAPTDVSYTVEVSGDLVTWNSGPSYTTQVSVTPIDAATQLVTVRDNVAVGGATPRFIRVSVSQ